MPSIMPLSTVLRFVQDIRAYESTQNQGLRIHPNLATDLVRTNYEIVLYLCDNSRARSLIRHVTF